MPIVKTAPADAADSLPVAQTGRAPRGRPAAFLDRDGTLNHDGGYTHRVEDFRWIDDAPAAIRLLNTAGYLVFIVTNQSGIARGYYRDEDVQRLHAHMQRQLRRHGAHIDDLRYCPHHPDGRVAALATSCHCRKPATGMLDSLVRQWRPDLSRSFMLGDTPADVAAGNAMGIISAQIAPGQLLGTVRTLLAAAQ